MNEAAMARVFPLPMATGISLEMLAAGVPSWRIYHGVRPTGGRRRLEGRRTLREDRVSALFCPKASCNP